MGWQSVASRDDDTPVRPHSVGIHFAELAAAEWAEHMRLPHVPERAQEIAEKWIQSAVGAALRAAHAVIEGLEGELAAERERNERLAADNIRLRNQMRTSE